MLTDLLDVAVLAAQKAGEYLADAQREGRVILLAEPRRDVKLEADRRSEQLICEILREKSTISILAEEQGFIEVPNSLPELCWIIDPLDGSVNYSSGIPMCCISIGLWRQDEPLLGVVYDFCRDELFTGIVGVGAWLNGEPVRVSGTDAPEKAVLCTGFPVSTDFSPDGLMEFVEQVRAYKKVRLFGSAALSLAYVAAGRADVYQERDVKIWDVAAGLAVVRAAGGTVVWTGPSRAETGTAYAGAPSLPHPCLS